MCNSDCIVLYVWRLPTDPAIKFTKSRALTPISCRTCGRVVWTTPAVRLPWAAVLVPVSRGGDEVASLRSLLSAFLPPFLLSSTFGLALTLPRALLLRRFPPRESFEEVVLPDSELDRDKCDRGAVLRGTTTTSTAALATGGDAARPASVTGAVDNDDDGTDSDLAPTVGSAERGGVETPFSRPPPSARHFSTRLASFCDAKIACLTACSSRASATSKRVTALTRRLPLDLRSGSMKTDHPTLKHLHSPHSDVLYGCLLSPIPTAA
mmetsp:Transcript_31822/g.95696  ORF Transcript_31822/g.95696 Transcript_31822/m.95696 type:complete len:266 (-) Transcript_31822:274-1071(-)